MFDKDRTGYVHIEDLNIFSNLGRNPDEAC
jgi:hypothetical protein